MNVVHFATVAQLRRWFERNHASVKDLWIGFYRKGTGGKGVDYHEAVDLALCFGWIDGIKKKVDDISYTHRFTPRKPKSIWSAINLQRALELKRSGEMAPSGLAAYEGRDPSRAGLYSFENKPKAFDAASAKRFRANAGAWKFFQAQPPGYRRLATFWVLSAKRQETRDKRLAELIDVSAHQRRLGALAAKGKAAPKR
jgi:uncharacterized protein YdeI (YjbR/CyaY-like superfamily)